MHDLPDVLSLLDRLPERVSRQSTLDAVSAELNGGQSPPRIHRGDGVGMGHRRWHGRTSDRVETHPDQGQEHEYLDLLAGWGEAYGRTRAQVETEIFRLATGRGRVVGVPQSTSETNTTVRKPIPFQSLSLPLCPRARRNRRAAWWPSVGGGDGRTASGQKPSLAIK